MVANGMTTDPIAILLIDDDDDDNFFHKRAIDKSGVNCVVDVCSSSIDALDYLQNKGQYAHKGSNFPAPDIIFLDINMPKMNGWEFLNAYAALPDPPHTKPKVVIIMLSTSTSHRDKDRALATPLVKDFMEKPLKPEGLVSVVKNYIEQTN